MCRMSCHRGWLDYVINCLQCFAFKIVSFIALTLLLGGRKGIRPVKNRQVRYWRAWLSVWSEVQMICVWPCWCYCCPIISCSSKIQIGLPFWCRLNEVVLEKRLLNGCSSSSCVINWRKCVDFYTGTGRCGRHILWWWEWVLIVDHCWCVFRVEAVMYCQTNDVPMTREIRASRRASCCNNVMCKLCYIHTQLLYHFSPPLMHHLHSLDPFPPVFALLVYSVVGFVV